MKNSPTPQPSGSYITLTDKEKTLIMMMRKMGDGTLETISVRNGEPSVVVTTIQRVDLDSGDHMQRLNRSLMDLSV